MLCSCSEMCPCCDEFLLSVFNGCRAVQLWSVTVYLLGNLEMGSDCLGVSPCQRPACYATCRCCCSNVSARMQRSKICAVCTCKTVAMETEEQRHSDVWSLDCYLLVITSSQASVWSDKEKGNFFFSARRCMSKIYGGRCMNFSRESVIRISHFVCKKTCKSFCWSCARIAECIARRPHAHMFAAYTMPCFRLAKQDPGQIPPTRLYPFPIPVGSIHIPSISKLPMINETFCCLVGLFQPFCTLCEGFLSPFRQIDGHLFALTITMTPWAWRVKLPPS
jgi:hypothetical protein